MNNTKQNRRASITRELSMPCTSFWLRAQFNEIQKRDCVDAYYDALQLAKYAKLLMDGKI